MIIRCAPCLKCSLLLTALLAFHQLYWPEQPELLLLGRRRHRVDGPGAHVWRTRWIRRVQYIMDRAGLSPHAAAPAEHSAALKRQLGPDMRYSTGNISWYVRAFPARCHTDCSHQPSRPACTYTARATRPSAPWSLLASACPWARAAVCRPTRAAIQTSRCRWSRDTVLATPTAACPHPTSSSLTPARARPRHSLPRSCVHEQGMNVAISN